VTWRRPVNSQLFRQLSIGITEKHVREIHKPFNRYDDKGFDADLNVAFAWQSGHRPLQRRTTYGLDGAFPTRLQPALLRAYEWASTRWHEFLQLPSRVTARAEAAMIEGGAESLSSQPRPSFDVISVETSKRKSAPLHHDRLDDTRPIKRKTTRKRQDPPQVGDVGDVSASQPRVPAIAKRPANPTEIMAQVEAWKDGAADKPVSDDESDSTIDWDEPDMVPSATLTDGSLPSWSRAPWPSWSRHNVRIKTKIYKARQFHGVFNLEELNSDEQKMLKNLKTSLGLWSDCCIICDFKGTPIRHHHSTNDCSDSLNCAVKYWAPLFQTRLQRLTETDTQSCPVCFIPRLICDCWKQGEPSKWVETGSNCQYNGVIIVVIVTALEQAVEVREELDTWMDLSLHSRNLDSVCQWLSGRSVDDYLCGLRIVEAFTIVSSAWGRLSSTNVGYHSPACSWITSTGPVSKADEAADEAAYASRERKRKNQISLIKREGRDEHDLEDRLGSWIEKCPVCYTRKGEDHEADVYHGLETCKDARRDLVAMEIAKLQEIKFVTGVCCSSCAVPRETCNDASWLYREDNEEACLYRGIVREAVAAMMVVGPDIVVQKMYAWMRSEGIWTGTTSLKEEEVQQVTQMMLEWFSRKSSYPHFTASVLVQVFNQLDRWLEAFKKGVELEDWFRID
jgi:hypothetical protein